MTARAGNRRALIAWERRGAILAAGRHPEPARRFLAFVAERSRSACSVAEASRHLGVSRSGLERICVRAFDLPPGLLINLGRVVSIARDLRETQETLKRISAGHAFVTPSIMNRFFTRFVGLPPAMYRERALRGTLRRPDLDIRHCGHGPNDAR